MKELDAMICGFLETQSVATLRGSRESGPVRDLRIQGLRLANAADSAAKLFGAGRYINRG